MDADCLIKLTKAQLKEGICAAFEVSIPSRVRAEVMVNAASHPECAIVRRNLEAGVLAEIKGCPGRVKGEDALLAAFEGGDYAAIASDDKRFVKKLRLLGIPYITPAVLLLAMVKGKRLTVEEGFSALDRLSHMVSDDEVAVVKLKLGSLRDGR